jgi:hypothetical protein
MATFFVLNIRLKAFGQFSNRFEHKFKYLLKKIINVPTNDYKDIIK